MGFYSEIRNIVKTLVLFWFKCSKQNVAFSTTATVHLSDRWSFLPSLRSTLPDPLQLQQGWASWDTLIILKFLLFRSIISKWGWSLKLLSFFVFCFHYSGYPLSPHCCHVDLFVLKIVHQSFSLFTHDLLIIVLQRQPFSFFQPSHFISFPAGDFSSKNA